MSILFKLEHYTEKSTFCIYEPEPMPVGFTGPASERVHFYTEIKDGNIDRRKEDAQLPQKICQRIINWEEACKEAGHIDITLFAKVRKGFFEYFQDMAKGSENEIPNVFTLMKKWSEKYDKPRC